MTNTAAITATVQANGVAPANVVATIGYLGQQDRQASEVLGRTIPPKLEAALIMADNAYDGKLNVGHIDVLMTAYYGNNMPASAAQQKAKFNTFLKAGQAQLPVVAVVYRAAEMIDSAKRLAAETSDAKARAKEMKAAEKMGAGIFEKAVNMARAQAKAGKVMLSDAEIRAVLAPERAESEDPFGDMLEDLMAKAEKTGANGVYQGYPEIMAAIGAAISAHQRGRNAPMIEMPTPMVGTASGEIKNEVVTLEVIPSEPSSGHDELDALLETA